MLELLLAATETSADHVQLFRTWRCFGELLEHVDTSLSDGTLHPQIEAKNFESLIEIEQSIIIDFLISSQMA